MARITVLICIVMALIGVASFFSSDILKKLLSSKSNLAAVVAAKDIKTGEEFRVSNTGSKLISVYSWRVTQMPVREALYERRASRNIKSGEPIFVEDVMSADRAKWTNHDEKLNRESMRMLPGYQNFFYPRCDIKKGEVLMTMFITRRQVPPGGYKALNIKENMPTDEVKDEIPADAIRSLAELRGTKAKHLIKARTIIRRRDLERF